jgi:phosphotransferase system IIB component
MLCEIYKEVKKKMIFLFRKEIRKWNAVWWVVLASLMFGLGGASFYLLWNPRREELKVVSVNSDVVRVKEFKQVFGEMKASLDDLSMYWGISVEQLAKMMGMGDMVQASINRSIQNLLIDKVWKDFDLRVDGESFQKHLASTASRRFIDRSGRINMKAYQNYLSRLQMSVADYENSQEKDFKRNNIFRLLKQGGYVPSYVLGNLRDKKTKEKKFKILSLPMSYFLEKAKTHEATDLKKFFKDNQALYKVDEKKKVRYWAVTPEDYADNVSVSHDLIERFYERNKSSLYRVPPKVKVRVITFQDMASANQMHKSVNADPKLFEKKGKLVDYFERGTHDPDFERVAFLKLKEVGDISEVVKIENDFQIIKLEGRILATEKPLDLVRDDVEKTLINRKAVVTLKSDMESVVRLARKDPEIFEKFSKDSKLESKESDWLTEKDISGGELTNTLAQKIFSRNKKVIDYGYFVHRGEHVSYKVTDRKESYIPSYDAVADKVKEDWYARKAEELQKETVKKLRRLPESLDELGKEYGLSIINTKFIPINGEIDDIKGQGDIAGASFALNDPRQLLLYKHDKNCYLVTFVKDRAITKDKPEDKGEAELESEKRRLKQRYLDAFVASLQRNAKIEINQKVLKEGAF